MSRIPYPTREQLSEAQRAYLDQPDRRMLNIARMAMHTPEAMWKAQLDMATAAVFQTSIAPRLKEVLILRHAFLAKCEYEQFHHRSLARSMNIPDAVVDALESGDFAALAEDERVVAQFTTEVVRDVKPSDETVAAARAIFSDAQIFEMIGLIGIYMITARIIGVSGVAIDEVPVSDWNKEKTG